MSSPNCAGHHRRTLLASALGLGLGSLAPGRPAQALELVNGVVIGKSGWLFNIYDDPRHTQLTQIEESMEVLTEAMRLFKAGGLPCALVVTPSKARIYPEFLPDDFRFTTDSERRYDMVLAELRKTGALVPDEARLLQAYRKSQPGDSLYFKTDTHWTAAAAELAATDLAEQIGRLIPLPPAPGRGMELLERAETPGNSNDLGSLLPLAQRSNYPAESQMIRRPAPTKGRDGLLDNDRSDVAVVGNSFVQPKYNFAPMLSSKLGRPVTLTWQVHTFGPYRTLTDYLKGSEFRQQRPKLLVLNLLEQAINLLPSNKNAFPSGFMSVDEFLSTIRKAVA